MGQTIQLETQCNDDQVPGREASGNSFIDTVLETAVPRRASELWNEKAESNSSASRKSSSNASKTAAQVHSDDVEAAVQPPKETAPRGNQKANQIECKIEALRRVVQTGDSKVQAIGIAARPNQLEEREVVRSPRQTALQAEKHMRDEKKCAIDEEKRVNSEEEIFEEATRRSSKKSSKKRAPDNDVQEDTKPTPAPWIVKRGNPASSADQDKSASTSEKTRQPRAVKGDGIIVNIGSATSAENANKLKSAQAGGMSTAPPSKSAKASDPAPGHSERSQKLLFDETRALGRPYQPLQDQTNIPSGVISGDADSAIAIVHAADGEKSVNDALASKSGRERTSGTARTVATEVSAYGYNGRVRPVSEEDETCVVVFTTQARDRLGPFRVAKSDLCRGNAVSKNSFEESRPGTAVFAKFGIFVAGKLTVHMGVRGEIVNEPPIANAEVYGGHSMSRIRCSLAHIENESTDDYATVSSTLKLPAVAGESQGPCLFGRHHRNRFSPHVLYILRDDKVRIKWNASDETGNLEIVEADKNFKPKNNGYIIHDSKGENWGMRRFVAKGVHRLVCVQYPEARLTIHVVANWYLQMWKTLQIVFAGILPAVAVVSAAWFIVSLVEGSDIIGMFFDCKGMTDFCDELDMLEGYLFGKAGVYLVCALLMFLVYVPAAIFKPCLVDTELHEYGRGFHDDFVNRIHFVARVFMCLPLTVLLVAWAANIYLGRGFKAISEVFQEMADGVSINMNEVMQSLDVIQNAADALGKPIDRKHFSGILNYDELGRSYAALGLELLNVFVNLRICMYFCTSLFFTLAFSKGVAGLIHRSSKLLRSSCWHCVPVLILLLVNLSVDSFFHALYQDTFDNYVDASGKVRLSDDRSEGNAVALVLSCEKASEAGPNSTSVVPYQSFRTPVNSLLTGLEDIGIGFGLLPTQSSELRNYVQGLEADKNRLDAWLTMPSASDVELDLHRMGLSVGSLQDVTSASLSMLKILLSLLECTQIAPFVENLVQVLADQFIPYMELLVISEFSMILVTVLWVLLAMKLEHVFDRPLKHWYDQVSKRWFRFRVSYKVAVKLRKKHRGDKFVAKRQAWNLCDPFKWVQAILHFDSQNNVTLLIASCMILTVDGEYKMAHSIMQGGSACLVVSAAMGLVGNSGDVASARRRLFRLASVMFMLVGVCFQAYAAHQNAVKASNCLDKFEYSFPLPDGPSVTTVAEARCSAASNCSFWIVGKSLANTDRMIAIDEGKVCKDLVSSKNPFFVFSHPAEVFGRKHIFSGDELFPGVYNLCWCSSKADCDQRENYQTSGGILFVNKAIDWQKTCSPKAVAAFVEAAFLGSALAPLCLLKLLFSVASLQFCVYSKQITQQMRKAASLIHRSKREVDRVSLKDIHGGICRRLRKKVYKFWQRSADACGLLLGLIAFFACINYYVLVLSGKEVEGESVSITTSTTTYWSVPTGVTSCFDCCNGQSKEETCNKPLDEVTFAASHNTMSTEESAWLFPNNIWNFSVALEFGIRAFMFDAYYFYPDDSAPEEFNQTTPVYLCHGYCTFGSSKLSESLHVLKAFLENNPREVIVLIFEQYVASASLVKEFDEAGLTKYFYSHAHPGSRYFPSWTPWPTLQELIDNDTRLIFFSDHSNQYTKAGSKHAGPLAVREITNLAPWDAVARNATWFHWMWHYFAETDFLFTDAASMELNCALKRGATDAMRNGSYDGLAQSGPVRGRNAHRLLIMHHFITDPVARPAFAEIVNAQSFLDRRINHCKSVWGHHVNFVNVDFWSLGDVMNSTFNANGQKRLKPPTYEKAPIQMVCEDIPKTTFSINGGEVAATCEELKHACDTPDHGSFIKEQCPVTCAVCMAPMQRACVDNSPTNLAIKEGVAATCEELHTACDHVNYGRLIREQCPVTCGVCAERAQPPSASPTPSPTQSPTQSLTEAIRYTKHSGFNCYNGKGATNIDYSNTTGVANRTVEECKERCTNDVDCDCFVHRMADQICLRRSDCVLSHCAPSTGWDIYVKEAQAPANDHDVVEYVYGELGKRECPAGYTTIMDGETCKAASRALGDAYYSTTTMDGGPLAICHGRACGAAFNQGGGCKNIRHTVLATNQGTVAKWVCKKKVAQPSIGDCVNILPKQGTHVPSYRALLVIDGSCAACPIVGNRYRITTVDGSNGPYQVGSCGCWLKSTRVELVAPSECQDYEEGEGEADEGEGEAERQVSNLTLVPRASKI